MLPNDWIIEPLAYTPPPPAPAPSGLHRSPAIRHNPKKRSPPSNDVIPPQRLGFEKEKPHRSTREEQKVKADRDDALKKLTAGPRPPAPVNQALYMQLLNQMYGPKDARATPGQSSSPSRR